MKILIVAPQVPWPMHQGTSLRNGNIVLELARRHEVHVVAFAAEGSQSAVEKSAAEQSTVEQNSGEQRAEGEHGRRDRDASIHGPLSEAGVTVHTVAAPAARPTWRRVFDLPTTLVPDLARRLDSRAMDALARSVASEGAFDVVQIEGLEMARHGLVAAAAARASGRPHGHANRRSDKRSQDRSQQTMQKPTRDPTQDQERRVRILYDAHNAEWVLQDRAWRADLRRLRGWLGALYSRIQTAKLRRFERTLLASVDAVVAVSDADAAALRAVADRGAAPITVVPNGVDIDALRPSEGAVEAGTCLFIGKMDFRPNVDAMVWLCRYVWPEVRRREPGARLWIVGRDPSPTVRALADEDNGVTVVGGVPSVESWLARAAVVVVPLRIGGGTRLKVLEAMAAGKAIAATTMAVEGLRVADDHEALLADAAPALADAIVRLLGDDALRARLGAQARRRVEDDYPWSALVPHIEARYTSS